MTQKQPTKPELADCTCRIISLNSICDACKNSQRDNEWNTWLQSVASEDELFNVMTKEFDPTHISDRMRTVCRDIASILGTDKIGE